MHLTHNNTVFLLIAAFVLLLILGSIVTLRKQNISFNIEYVLFIFLIILAGHLLVSSSNLFTSIFCLEFIALLIFGKFAVSKILIRNNNIKQNTTNYVTNYSYGLFNSLFFQFWANFTSSVFLFFSLTNTHYLCGTSNFYLLNFLFYILNFTQYLTVSFVSMFFIIFITGFFIKLGLSPYQFFKIETYKGVPLLW